MKFAVVHLSDIHFRTKNDLCVRRAGKLANAIKFACSPDERIILVVTGDIANTGSPGEYKVAEDFFRPLLISLGVHLSTNPELVLIPGNHDCNFRELGDLRPGLLADIQEKLDTIDPNGETVRTLLQVQSGFFDFYQSLIGRVIPQAERLFSIQKFSAGGSIVEFRCFNSAWLSTRHEDPGTLGLPQAVIASASTKTDSDIVVSVIHHPSNWLTPNGHHVFRSLVQQNSDFLFTGHEHEKGGQIVSAFGGATLVHLESGPLQPVDSGESEFGILHLDLTTRQWKHEHFWWNSGAYSRMHEQEWTPLFDKTQRAASLRATTETLNKLNETGTGFLHPRLTQLTLPDIYVFPDLKSRAISRKLITLDDLPKEIPGKEVAQRLLSARKVVVAGPNDSGKTALGKMLYLEGNAKFGKYCLLIDAKDLRGRDPVDALIALIESNIEQQYGKKSQARYQGVGSGERALIIDNWEDTPFNRTGKAALLKRATALFGTTILLTDDIFLIDEISGRYGQDPIGDFEIVDIREFGFRLRGQLIRKWHTLGMAYVEDEEAVAHAISESTRVVDTSLGRNLLPSYPVNILTLLQNYDSEAGTQNGGLGSYGQVYEALITAQLAKVSVKTIDIGTKITFLSRLAWRLFDSGKRCIGPSEWVGLCDQYFADYRIRLNSEELLASCASAGVLRADEGGFRFTYGYGYCYFVAKYFQENLADPDNPNIREELFERLKRISQRVYNQNNANIVIFYVFLTKDRILINHILSNARRIFEGAAEFDFDSHALFVNRIMGPNRLIELPVHKPEVNEDEYNQRRDESGVQLEPKGDPSAGDVPYGPEIALEHKIIIAFRYIALMGQILRNFPGSLKADTKLDLAFETYALGLRMLTTLFDLAQKESDSLVKDITRIIVEKMAFNGTDRELRERAEEIVSDMLRQLVYAIVKRVSHAVGLSELEATYEELSDLRDNNLANQFVNLSIRLDHFTRFPKEEILSIYKAVDSNQFGRQTLRDLVLNHLYLFPCSYVVQQWVGDTFDVKVNLPSIRGAEKKLLKSGK